MNTKIIFYSIFSACIFLMLLGLITNPSYTFNKHFDEIQYHEELNQWNEYGHDYFVQNIYTNDNKPLVFFYILSALQHDKTNIYSRILVLILVFLISFIMFKKTGRYESFLFIVFPFIFNAMWLNVEIIELFFLMLSFYYKKYSGIFIGLATIFRPYALLYTVMLKKTQVLYVILIGAIYSAYLMYLGIFFTYLNRVLYYTSMQRLEIDYLGVFILFCFAICAYKSKEIFKYGLIGAIPLLLRTWSHYIITPIGLFIFAYLYLNKKE